MALIDEAGDARIGTVVGDKYRITRLIGGGGAGRVYEAEHTVLGQHVAVKLVLPKCAANRETWRRVQNEAKSASHLEHPNIATIDELGIAADGSPYFVMEYLVGQNCAQLLSSVGPLPIERACDIVYQACMGISVAHQAGIVHRNIKPTNLFITRATGGADLVKILDLGISKLHVSGRAHARGHYLAPEQVRDAGRVDRRADIWALGVVLYELLTGRRPFDGPDTAQVVHQISFEAPQPPNEVRAALPGELISAIDLALEKDPEHRFETVLAFADAIGPATGHPLRRASNLAISQRLPLLTPVDPAYDPAQPAVPVLTNAPVSRSIMASRQRAYRVYTLLGLAALIGFAAGGLTRRLVNQKRATAALAAADRVYPEASTGTEVSSLAGQRELDSVPAVAAVATAASVPTAALESKASAATSAAELATATTSAQPNTPMRLVRASPDGGTLKAVVERGESLPAASGSAPSAQPATSARPSAPKPSVAPVQTTAPVPDQPSSELDAPSSAHAGAN